MAPRKGAKKAKTKAVVENVASTEAVNEEHVAELITTLTPVTDADGSGTVRYYVDDQGRYYYGPYESEVHGEAMPTQEKTVEIPNTMIDNDKLSDLLKSTNDCIIVFQPSNDADGNQIVEIQSQDISYQEISQECSDIMFVQDVIEPQECVEMQEFEEVEILEEELQIDDTEAVESGGKEEAAITIYEFEEEESEGVSQSQQIKTTNRVVQQNNNFHKFIAEYNCPNCTYTSNRKYLMLPRVKPPSEDKSFVCTYCDHKFKTVTALQNHLNTHKGLKPHICKHCQTTFTTSGELVRHVRYKHTLEKPHKCNECDYASVELSKLKRHQRCHTGERPYQCRHCTYASPDTFKLKRHVRTHTGEKPYKCDECKLSFTQSNTLKNHKLTHNVAARPVFNCQLCPATCKRKTDLRIHIKNLHSTQKQYKCKRCGKVFLDRYTFKNHNKSHDGEKCFKCDLCPYASTTVRHLKSHLLKHSGEKPFQCDECDQSFRQKQLLRRHENLYHKPDYVPTPPKEKSHECNKCRRQFAHKGNLIRHMAVHDPDNNRKTLLTQPNELTVETEIQPADGEEVEFEVVEQSGNENEEILLTQAIYMTHIDDEGVEEQVVTSQPVEVEGEEYLVFQVVQGEYDNNEGETTATIQLPINANNIKLYQEPTSSNGTETCFAFTTNEEVEMVDIDEYMEEVEVSQEPVILNLHFNDAPE